MHRDRVYLSGVSRVRPAGDVGCETNRLPRVCVNMLLKNLRIEMVFK